MITFRSCFFQLAHIDVGFSLLEEFPLRLRPVFKALVLSSGMLTTLGAMIGCNILLDSQGLPYLAEYCYYYTAWCNDQAVTCVSIDDIGANFYDVQYILVKPTMSRISLILHEAGISRISYKCRWGLTFFYTTKKLCF